MLLKLIRNTCAQSTFHCLLVENDPIKGEKPLAKITESADTPMLELFYPLSVTLSGINLRGQPVPWRWKKNETKLAVENYLRQILNSGEEILLEITHPEPDLPGYPYVNHNAYERGEIICRMLKANDGDSDADD